MQTKLINLANLIREFCINNDIYYIVREHITKKYILSTTKNTLEIVVNENGKLLKAINTFQYENKKFIDLTNAILDFCNNNDLTYFVYFLCRSSPLDLRSDKIHLTIKEDRSFQYIWYNE